MADHQQSSDEAAAAAATSPTKQIVDCVAFINGILLELQADPDVQEEFVELLSGFEKHGGDADTHAVKSRAAELLRDHPDVLRRITEFIYMDVPPSAEQILALTTRTRRRTSRRRNERRGTLKQQTPAAHVVFAAAARNDGSEGGRPRRSADAALAFIKRVHDTAGPVIHARFLDVLSEAKGSEDMFADEIYDRVKRAFGPAHVGLLHAFATVWLPGAQEWKLQQQQQQARGPTARQLSRAAAGMPGAKKPRADDDGNAARRHDTDALGPQRQRNRVAVASAHAVADAKKPRAHVADNGRRHDHVIAVLEVRNVKKRRNDDDGLGYDYAARSRAKKPYIGNGEFSGSAAAARVLGTEATGVHHAYSGDNDKKPPRRRAGNGGEDSSAGAAAGPERERDDEVRRFRQEWEFQTWYSKLVATSDRVTELLRATRTPHGDGRGDGKRSLVALFPLPECREFLRNCYGARCGKMSAALERGESRVPALEAIEHRLTAKEEEAVVEESRKRRRHDPARVAQRLQGLSMDYVTLEEECRRRHHGGGA